MRTLTPARARRTALASTAAAVMALTLSTAVAQPAAAGGGTAFWPASFPLYAPPGVVQRQTGSSATVYYRDDLGVVVAALDSLYAARGCTLGGGKVNVYRYWLCRNASTNKIDEIDTTAGRFDVTATQPNRSFVNFTLVAG